MTEDERHQKIKAFIRENPRIKNKADVMRYMAKNVSPPTTFKDLTYLEENGKIISLKEKSNSQTHYLIVNDENKFNILEKKIDEYYDMINGWTEGIGSLLSDMKSIRDLAIFYQLWMNSLISSIATQISRDIEPGEERDSLYLRLVQLLKATSKMSSILGPTLIPTIDKFCNAIDRAALPPEKKETFNEIRKGYLSFRKWLIEPRKN